MTLSERGSRHKRIWVETRTHLGRDTNASGTRHTCACSHVRQQVVSNRTVAVWGTKLYKQYGFKIHSTCLKLLCRFYTEYLAIIKNQTIFAV